MPALVEKCGPDYTSPQVSHAQLHERFERGQPPNRSTDWTAFRSAHDHHRNTTSGEGLLECRNKMCWIDFEGEPACFQERLEKVLSIKGLALDAGSQALAFSEPSGNRPRV